MEMKRSFRVQSSGKQHGSDLMYTSSSSSEGLIEHAAQKVGKLDIFDYERPIGISRIFGNEIQSMREAAAIVEEARPDILDI